MDGEGKLFYSIGEAAQILEVKPYVLRYWESEFRRLNPQKSETGQRTYRLKDLQIAMAIKNLLYEEKYTIAGAIKRLEELERTGLPALDPGKLGSVHLAEPSLEDPPQPSPGTPKTAPRQGAKEFMACLVESRSILAKYGF
jgi:DNA-binding transcriptional MerR regulator